ncbi:MAG: hypothetical protein ACFB2Y_24735 [Fulvivirga sp.]
MKKEATKRKLVTDIFSTGEINLIRNQFCTSDTQQFPEKALSLIYDKSLFKLYIPRALHGQECTFREALECFIHTAYIDGDFGWAVQIGSGGGIFAGYVQKELADAYFKDPKFVIAGSGHPTALAKTGENGYVVNGSWQYCSGCEYATLITANCKTEDGGVMAVALLPEQIQIDKDWKGYGMSNTVSHTVTVNSKFVHRNHTFQVNQMVSDYDYKMFYMPFPIYAKANIFATVVGCFDHLLEETYQLTRSDKWTQDKKVILTDIWQKASHVHDIHKQNFLNMADQCWAELVSTGQLSKTAGDELIHEINYSLTFMKKTAYTVFLNAGMAAINYSEPLNKTWRDISTAFQHAVLR